MSILPVYLRLIQILDSDTMSWILTKTLDHGTMVKLCNTCGITYTGMRTKSMPLHKLVPDLSSVFFEKPSSGEAITSVGVVRIQTDMMP